MIGWQDKIKTRNEVAGIVQRARDMGLRVGFTSGVFDLVHAGHVDFLQSARQRCDLLVVGLNSDQSVKTYKGPSRPLIEEQYRLITLAGIQAVDYVFLFEERRNQVNLETLRPDFYFKAGDYEPSQLTSSGVVSAYGGKVEILPLHYSLSTTLILDRAVAAATPRMTRVTDKVGISGNMASAMGTDNRAEERSAWVYSEDQHSVFQSLKPGTSKPALFVDRDGTINTEVEYLHQPEKFCLLPGSGEGLRKFQLMGYWIIVITTQAGIGLGYFSHEDFYRVNRAMFQSLKPFDVLIDRIYFCPHSIREACQCRKPGTLLIERAVADVNIDLSHSVMIGDKTSDIMTGNRLQIKTILVRSGHGGQDKEYEADPDMTADSLSHAADMILDHERNI